MLRIAMQRNHAMIAVDRSFDTHELALPAQDPAPATPESLAQQRRVAQAQVGMFVRLSGMRC